MAGCWWGVGGGGGAISALREHRFMYTFTHDIRWLHVSCSIVQSGIEAVFSSLVVVEKKIRGQRDALVPSSS